MTSDDDGYGVPCAHTRLPCKNRHDCERCKVPNAFGYFLYWKLGKSYWEQRFILEKDREAILNYWDYKIQEAEEAKVKLLAIPTKEEYLRSIADG